MPSIVDVLRTLPVPHRDFLVGAHLAKMAPTNRVVVKLEQLAKAVGTNGVAKYEDLYLYKGGLLTWYIFPNTDVSTAKIEAKLQKLYPEIWGGLFPELKWDEPPALHRMRRIGPMLIVELAALDAERSYMQNWKQRVLRYDERYIVALRDNPFTVEIRSAYGKATEIYKALADITGLPLTAGQRCAILDEKVHKLKRSLSATCLRSNHRHQDQEIARSSLEAQPGRDLETCKQWKAVSKAPHVTEFSRTYVFEFKHKDGYVEECEYRIRLSSGDIRVEREMSELAIDHLRKHVVALF